MKNTPLTDTLRTAAARIETSEKDRLAIRAELLETRAEVDRLLGLLDGTPAPAPRPQAFATRKGGRPKGYVMSAATKAKLRAAWKRRKAAQAR